MPRALKAALFAGIAALAWPGLRSLATEDRASFVMAYVDEGEALRHGVYPSPDYLVSARMPVEPLLESHLLIHCEPAAARRAVALAAALSLGLLWALGALLASPWAGWLAVFIGHAWWVPSWSPGGDFHKSFFFTLYVLLAAGALAWRARSPSRKTDLLAALSIGASLLVRSTLAFLPPVLFLYDTLGRGRRARKRPWRRAALLWLLPYLFLAPWVRMNWVRYHAFIPFERQAADANVVTGALGIVRTAESDPGVLMDEPGGENQSALVWALEQVARHPARYLAGWLGRLLFFIRLYPLLLAAALLSLWLHRDREEFRQLGLFCGYFVMIHCFMSVEERYFLPLVPLFSGLAAALLVFPFEIPGRKPAARTAKAIVAASSLPALAISVAAISAVSAHTRALNVGSVFRETALDSALAGQPQDAWLLFQKGEALLRAGEPGAAKELTSAVSLRPNLPRGRIDAAWAVALDGEPAALLALTPAPDWREEDALAVRLYQALACLRLKRATQAAEHFEAALAGRRGSALARSAAPLAGDLARAGYKHFVDDALRLPLSKPDRHALAALAKRERPGEDAALWDPAPDVPKMPERPEAWLDRAQAAAKAGDRRQAFAALERAQALSPGVESLPREAATWAEVREYKKALSAADSLVKLAPKDPDAWLLRADIGLQAGSREFALASLDRAAALSSDAPRRRRIALLYQENKSYAPALEILSLLTQASPADAGLKKDLGICQYGAGRLDEAQSSLREAIRLDPGLLDAYLSLGSILEGQGRRADARAVYDQALARPVRRPDEPIRQLLMKAREESQ
jgi:tetratricopeptide (TPR) repeat protein